MSTPLLMALLLGFGFQTTRPAPPGTLPLYEQIRSPQKSVSLPAMRTFVSQPFDEPRAISALVDRLEDPNAQVRVAALQALGKMPGVHSSMMNKLPGYLRRRLPPSVPSYCMPRHRKPMRPSLLF